MKANQIQLCACVCMRVCARTCVTLPVKAEPCFTCSKHNKGTSRVQALPRAGWWEPVVRFSGNRKSCDSGKKKMTLGERTEMQNGIKNEWWIWGEKQNKYWLQIIIECFAECKMYTGLKITAQLCTCLEREWSHHLTWELCRSRMSDFCHLQIIQMGTNSIRWTKVMKRQFTKR